MDIAIVFCLYKISYWKKYSIILSEVSLLVPSHLRMHLFVYE